MNREVKTIETLPVNLSTTKGSTMGRIEQRSFILKGPFGWTVSERKVPEFKRARSAFTASNMMSVTKLPAIMCKSKKNVYWCREISWVKVERVCLIHFLTS